MITLEYAPEQVEGLKREYAHAVEVKAPEFKFEGHEYLTAYAGYLLNYLDQNGLPS